MQGTRVRSLGREDLTCCRATKPVHHNYWACALEPAHHNYWSLHALEPVSHNYWAGVLQLLKPGHLEPVLRNKRATARRNLCTTMHSSPCLPQLENACTQQRRPNTAKKQKKLPLKKKKKKEKKERSLRTEAREAPIFKRWADKDGPSCGQTRVAINQKTNEGEDTLSLTYDLVKLCKLSPGHRLLGTFCFINYSWYSW